MEIKNIKIFKSSPIVIDLDDGEQIKIDKVPALATLTLFEDEEFVEKLYSLNDINAVIKSKLSNKEKIEKLKAASTDIVKTCKKHYRTIIETLQIALKKDEEWISDHIGHIEMVQIITAILVKSSEESQALIKKNNLKII